MNSSGQPIARGLGVVVPTFRRPQYLVRAVESLLRQNPKPSEVVVVNDDINFESGAIANLLADFDEVKVVQGLGRGVSAARNLGVSHISTEFVAFLDDDDYWLPGFMDGVLPALPDADLVCVSARILDSEGEQVRIMHPSIGSRMEIKRIDNPGTTGSTIVVRAELLRQIGGFDEELKMSNDKDLVYRLIDAGAHICCLGSPPLVEISAHSGSRLTSAKDERRLDSLRLYAAKHGIPSQDLARREYVIARHFLARSVGFRERIANLAWCFKTACRANVLAILIARLRRNVKKLHR
jgi:glycosyltransferase involved in cell wall biosynthesis